MEDKKDEISSENSALGGALRSVLRGGQTAIRAVSSASIGRLPRVPTQAIAKSAEKLGDALDIVEKIHSAHHQEKARSHISDRLRHSFRVSLSATPGILKSSVLGTILFSVYEGIYNRSTTRSNNPWYSSWSTVVAATGAGTIAGASHGITSWLWHSIVLHSASTFASSSSVRNLITSHLSTPDPLNPIGRICNHAFVHGSLFGSYALSKHLFSYALNDSEDHKWEHVLAVIVSATVSSVVCEYATLLGDPWDHGRVVSPRSLWTTSLLQRITNRSAIVPTVLGFLAYEYGNDVIDSTLRS